VTDPLIEKMVNDLKSVKPLHNRKLWLHTALCFLIVMIMILGGIGIRYDYMSAIKEGAMFWKPAIFFLIWLSSALLILDISRPNGSYKIIHLFPLLGALLILLWQIFIQSNQSSLYQSLSYLNDDTAFFCLSIVFICGLIVMTISWKKWLKHTASPHPATLGALAGLNAASIAATVYALHCDRDAIFFVILYYFIPILCLTLIGFRLGKKNLNW
jgi:hypothetical protein